MRFIVTALEILKSGDWDAFCRERGMDVYAMRDGRVEPTEEFELTRDEVTRFELDDLLSSHEGKASLPLHKYDFQIVTAADVPFYPVGDGWGPVAAALTHAAEHLESLAYEVVSLQPVNTHFGFIFYRKVAHVP